MRAYFLASFSGSSNVSAIGGAMAICLLSAPRAGVTATFPILFIGCFLFAGAAFLLRIPVHLSLYGRVTDPPAVAAYR